MTSTAWWAGLPGETTTSMLTGAGSPCAYFTDTATLPGAGTVPLNVARICTWTWMCAPPPVGPNIHANATGYKVIAAAFERVISQFPGLRR